MSAEGTVSWFKVPIIGMPGFPTCGLPVTEDGRLCGDDGDPLPIEERTRACGQVTTWCAGSLHFCAEHFPLIAEAMGDSAEAIERAWREHVA